MNFFCGQRHPSVGARHVPPDSLHSPYFPKRGPYSSTDPALLLNHLIEIREMGMRGGASAEDIIVTLSWWGQASRDGSSDTQGIQTDDRIEAVLAAALIANITIAWHLEPYPGRTAASVATDVDYLEQR